MGENSAKDLYKLAKGDMRVPFEARTLYKVQQLSTTVNSATFKY